MSDIHRHQYTDDQLEPLEGPPPIWANPGRVASDVAIPPPQNVRCRACDVTWRSDTGGWRCWSCDALCNLGGVA